MRRLFPDHDILEAASVVGRAIGEVSEAAVELVGRRLAGPLADAGLSELELALRMASLTDLMTPPMGLLLEATLRRHLEAAGAAAIVQAEREPGVDLGQAMLAIGFADLIGFTALSARRTPLEVSQLAAQLLHCAEETLPQHNARLVKTIGDAVMFTARDLGAACRAAIALRYEVKRQRDLPPLHVGIAFGPVLRAYADYFGGTVNIASRLCDAAAAGEVLVPEPGGRNDLRAAGFRLSRARELEMAGLQQRIRAVNVIDFSGSLKAPRQTRRAKTAVRASAAARRSS
jgi:class 3 adenylate cyclase